MTQSKPSPQQLAQITESLTQTLSTAGAKLSRAAKAQGVQLAVDAPSSVPCKSENSQT